jgi:hypothetical protein
MSDKEEVFKYGVKELADACGITPAYARVWLRDKAVAKAGRSYGWKTKSEVDALAKEYKAGGVKEDKKPAAKATPKATPKAKKSAEATA